MTETHNRERRKADRVLALIGQRVRNGRHASCHQTAPRLVGKFGVIAVEQRNARGMVQNYGLTRIIRDVTCSQFRAIVNTSPDPVLVSQG